MILDIGRLNLIEHVILIDYVFFSLKENIEKGVIANGMSLSSYQFRKFLHLNLSVLEQRGSMTA